MKSEEWDSLLARGQGRDSQDPEAVKGARTELVKIYYDRIFRFLLRRTRNVDRAKDLTQDTFEGTLKNLETFKGPEVCFSAYLYKTAARHAMADAKRVSALARLLAPLSDAKPLPDLQSKPADEFEVPKLVRAAIESVDELYREAVVLCDYAGLTYEEIAEELGVPLGTVRSRIFRGRKKFKEALRRIESEGLRASPAQGLLL